ncbi:MAG: type IV pilus assembly protein PilM [Bacillota bacterium]
MFFKNNIYTCIDIGSYAIKMAQIKNTGNKNYKILDTAIQQIPRETIADGIIKDESLMAAEIKSMLAMLKKKNDYIITSVPSNELLIRNVEMPKMDKKEIRESLKWEADEQLPYPVESAAIDFIKVEEEAETVKYLISAVKRNIVNNFLAPFERNNLKVSVVNTQPMALISLVEYLEGIEEHVAVIDIGYSITQVIIGTKDNIALARTVDTGGNQFTNIIMEIQGDEYDRAEKRKMEEGLKANQPDQEKEENLLDTVQLDVALGSDDRLNTLATTLIREITRSFDYFNSRNRGETISKVFITGGGSKLKGLKEMISTELERELIEIDPFKNSDYKKKEEKYCDECKDEFAVAVGLGVSEVMADES